MNIGSDGLSLIKSFEGCKLTAYKCPADVVTIGWGSTRYENGNAIKLGDVITQERADALFLNTLQKYVKAVEDSVTSEINQHQFDSLVSFAYNCGIGALQSSTLLKKVNKNPSDLTIKDEFLKWNKAKGIAIAGLTKRREAEAALYFRK